MSSRFKSIDIYGQTVSFTLNGEENHKTNCGAACSLTTIIILVFVYAVRTVDFLGKVDPKISMVEGFTNEFSFDLYADGYRFAISDIDPSLGKIQAFSRVYGTDAEKKIDLVPCD